MVKNYDMTLSPDGRLMGVIAWISDIRLLEVETDKRTKEFKSVRLAMDLRGHSKGTLSLTFNPQGTQVVTSAKDGKLRHWNVAVQFELREDAKLIRTLDLPPDFPLAEKLALSDKVLCLATGSTLRFYEFSEFRLLDEVPLAHSSDIKKLRVFSQGGKQFFCSAAQDGRVNIWRS
jgi:WD40 repeat protein